MTATTLPASRENLTAIAMMVASMAFFAVEDMLIKLAGATMPAPQIILILAAIGTPVFAGICLARRLPLWDPAALRGAILLRTVADVFAALSFVLALTLIPLTLATAILQASPLLVTAGAALFLGERVGWRRWAAVLIGFAGILVILRPGLEGFRPAALWAVAGVTLMSVRDLATRRVPPGVSSLQLSFWAYAALIPGGAAALALTGGAVRPDPPLAMMLVAAGLIGTVGYFLIVASVRIGEISAVIPFRYSRLVFALILGVAVFDERPDAATLIGAAMVVGAGLYAVLRERRLARPPAAR